MGPRRCFDDDAFLVEIVKDTPAAQFVVKVAQKIVLDEGGNFVGRQSDVSWEACRTDFVLCEDIGLLQRSAI